MRNQSIETFIETCNIRNIVTSCNNIQETVKKLKEFFNIEFVCYEIEKGYFELVEEDKIKTFIFSREDEPNDIMSYLMLALYFNIMYNKDVIKNDILNSCKGLVKDLESYFNLMILERGNKLPTGEENKKYLN